MKDIDNFDISTVPIEKIYEHPVVQELLEKFTELEGMDLEKNVKIPYVLKNKTLMSPGVWNGYFYSSDAIQDAYYKTAWDKKENRSLFLDHLDGTNGRMGSLTWIGEVKNARLEGESLIGDLIVVDKSTAMKLAYGAKMGISPRVSGNEEGNKMLNFKFDNFSVVINPAVKTAYINNQEVGRMTEEKKVELSTEPSPAITVGEAKVDAPTQPFKGPEGKPIQMAELSDEMIQVLSEVEAEMAGKVADIAKKAKEIIKGNPDMKWVDAMKQASKEMKELAVKPKEEEKKIIEPEKKVEPQMMSEKDMEKIAEMVCQKMKPATAKEMSEKSDESNIVHELSEKIVRLEAKLNEPAKVTIKTEELSAQADPDMAFMNMLKGI